MAQLNDVAKYGGGMHETTMDFLAFCLIEND